MSSRGESRLCGSLRPPTLNYDAPAEDCDLDYVPRQGRPCRLDNVVSTSSGFSGLHSVLVLRRFSPAERRFVQ